MKKLTIIALAVASLGLCGCVGQPAPVGGLIFAHYTLPSYASTTEFAGCPYDEVGTVRAEGTSFSILGLVLIGDAGIASTYEKACQDGGADAIKNLRADYRGITVLGLFASVTTRVEGTGVKFKKSNAGPGPK
jgi:hypothetical protein